MVMSRSTDQIGRVLSGRYRLIAPVGAGASAQVFLADDVRLKRRVAVKVLHDALADDDAFLRRFRAEAQAAAALNHPNILSVYDWGDDDGTPYLITEYLGGGSLRAMLDRGLRLTPSQALLVGLEATRGLDYAHRRGFVHRDIKPANLLFGEDGRLRIADFGLARALAEAAWTEPQGAVMGTARYASPEQAQGQPVDGRADVYSLGLSLIEAVTGRVPFASDTTIATLMARVGKPVEVPEALGLLKRPLERAGLPEAADRPDAGALAVALMAAAGDLPRPGPLPLVTSELTLPGGIDAGDDTLHGRGAGTVLAAPSRLPQPGEATVVGGLPVPPGAPPIFLDDELEPTHGGSDDDGPRYVGGRPRRRWPWVVVLVLLAAAVGGAGAWIYNDSQGAPTHPIPPLVGLEEERAREAIEQFRWVVQKETLRQDGTTPGQVVRTDPPRGEELEEGETITLFVSLGNTEADVPADLVVGKSVDEATQALADAGQFPLVVAQEVEHEEVPAGVVVSLGPDVPARLPKGSEVPVVVSTGPPPRTIPQGLSGKVYDEAAAALSAIQLVPKRVDEFHDTITPGKVISTRPGPGGSVARGGTVEVVVSKGPDVVKVPSVSGLTLDQANAALTSAGLTVGDAFGPANGKPFETDPPAGASVKRSTPVNIYLRR
ncbi:MAG: PASTA domain-containing protein [Acidimicrobiales bacterium]|nr:PASTA domain-containing protein [Acidimicrobiales bacterium]